MPDDAAGRAGGAARPGSGQGGDTRCALGIDVGGTAIKAVISDARGRRLACLERPTPHSLVGLTRQVERIVDELRERVGAGQVSRAPESPESTAASRSDGAPAGDGGRLGLEDLVSAVGVDVPGIVDEEEGLAVWSVNLGWRDLPMRDHMEKALGVPVVLSHDVRAGAWAESRWGAGGPDCLYLAVGTGIASALILGGSPVVGGGWAGEVGQMRVPDPDYPGFTAPMESVASASAMARRYAATLPGGAASPQGGRALAEGSLGVLRAMAAGDARARRVWETSLDALADVIAGGACMLGPVDVVVGGGLMRAGQERFFAPLHERVSSRLEHLRVPRVLPAALGSWAQALGSAGRALEADRQPVADSAANRG